MSTYFVNQRYCARIGRRLKVPILNIDSVGVALNLHLRMISHASVYRSIYGIATRRPLSIQIENQLFLFGMLLDMLILCWRKFVETRNENSNTFLEYGYFKTEIISI